MKIPALRGLNARQKRVSLWLKQKWGAGLRFTATPIQMIRQAVILAAGNGSRIQRFQGDIPKPLRKLGGLTLIKRAILSAKQAGITDFVVVVGYRAESIIRSLSEDLSLGVRLQFVVNPDYHRSNGLSLLSAKSCVQGPFLLMMADHVFDFKALEQILQQTLDSEEVRVGIDRKIDEVFDLADATKVKIKEDQVLELGKTLSDYQAIDMGVFLCSEKVFEVFEQEFQKKGDVSLSEGISLLALQNKVGFCDLSSYFWQDVDTPETLDHAEKYLFTTLKKPMDGWVSQHINRRISFLITRLFLKTHFSANHVTGLVTLIGILSAYFVSTGKYFEVAVGGVLFNLASILDGCDGELAKLKMSSSKLGEWLDTCSDNLTYLFFFAGTVIGISRQGKLPYLAFESVLLFGGLAFTLTLFVCYLIRFTQSGSFVTLQKDLSTPQTLKKRNPFFSALTKIQFMMKRDFFALLFMSLALFNQLPWILHLSTLGANLTWMVILFYKREIFKFQPAALLIKTPSVD